MFKMISHAGLIVQRSDGLTKTATKILSSLGNPNCSLKLKYSGYWRLIITLSYQLEITGASALTAPPWTSRSRPPCHLPAHNDYMTNLPPMGSPVDVAKPATPATTQIIEHIPTMTRTNHGICGTHSTRYVCLKIPQRFLGMVTGTRYSC